MLKFIKSKKGLAVLATLAALASAIGAYAYFSSTGSGAGTGSTATAASLTIKEIGAGYDSLNQANTYSQDQSYNDAGLSSFGDVVNLANPGYQQLTSVVVAFRNWDTAPQNVPITLVVNGYTVTETKFFPGAPAVGKPSFTTQSFDFSAQDAFINSPVKYEIQYDGVHNASPGFLLNVALTDGANHGVSVGSDQDPNAVWLNTQDGTLGNDFPTCSTTPNVATGVFESVKTNCGPANANNPGAYGNFAGVNDNEDTPAVEINVVGGVAPDLSPGVTAPISFAITNPGTTSVTENSVTTSISSVNNGLGACSTEWKNSQHPGPTSDWYVVGGSPVGPVTVPPGTSLFTATGTTLTMVNDPTNNQNDCQGAAVNLAFASS